MVLLSLPATLATVAVTAAAAPAVAAA